MYRDYFVFCFRTRLNEIVTTFLDARRTYDPDAVHDLRVALKRARTLFRLVHAINPVFDEQTRFNRFAAIASNTSHLRDFHVQRNLAIRLGKRIPADLAPYIAYLDDGVRAAYGEFTEFAAQFPLDKLSRIQKPFERRIDEIPHELARERSLKLYTNLKDEFFRLGRAGSRTHSLLHTVRKLSKMLHYLVEIYTPAFSPAQDKGASFIAPYKSCHKVLGYWHDLMVCSRHFEEWADTAETETAGSLKAVRSYIAREAEKSVSDFNDKLKEFSVYGEKPLWIGGGSVYGEI